MVILGGNSSGSTELGVEQFNKKMQNEIVVISKTAINERK
jgi:hypothetical protein